MDDTLRGGYDIFGGAGIHAEVPLDRAQPVVDGVEQDPDRVGHFRALKPHARRGSLLQALRLALDRLDHPRAERSQV